MPFVAVAPCLVQGAAGGKPGGSLTLMCWAGGFGRAMVAHLKPEFPMRLFLALAASLLAAPALADEVWSSALGPFAWETDIDQTAVLRLDEVATGGIVRFLVPGLPLDVNGGRGAYSGLWIANGGDARCLADVVDPVSGAKSPYWGTFNITFVGTGFPSDWAGVWGSCLDAPVEAISAVAVVGE